VWSFGARGKGVRSEPTPGAEVGCNTVKEDQKDGGEKDVSKYKSSRSVILTACPGGGVQGVSPDAREITKCRPGGRVRLRKRRRGGYARVGSGSSKASKAGIA